MIVDLVDSYEYITSNCFQAQLTQVLHSLGEVTTVSLADMPACPKPERVISRLKQRSLLRDVDVVSAWSRGAPVTIYDQDPWHAFMNDSQYKGAYDVFKAKLNVKSFCVTTKSWCDFMLARGYDAQFVSMWVLPEYCDATPKFVERNIAVGFAGTMHPHRQSLSSILQDANVSFTTYANALPYRQFLQRLSTIQIFPHNEDLQLNVDNEVFNTRSALWIKDIEAIARGCFSIRPGNAEEAGSYLKGLSTFRLYDDIRQVPDLIKEIQTMDIEERQALIEHDIALIKEANRWIETARTLTA